MFVCVYVCDVCMYVMYVCDVCMSVCTVFICMYVSMYVNALLGQGGFVSIASALEGDLGTCEPMYVCYVSMYVCMYVCIYVWQRTAVNLKDV